ncbi:GTP-binding protein Obg [Lentilactobacillus kosonis]|uniref:GTP-binding protein Obg n=1 Tax=Lentilactobacillus kosonis TaxID=2810561 RepID=A0A401FP67_9LACO|nr:GTP-binding protein Obg [Lentilactobacillus kosonis]
MFVDQVKIDVKAGNGGNGMVAFGAKSTFLMAALLVVMAVTEPTLSLK